MKSRPRHRNGAEAVICASHLRFSHMCDNNRGVWIDNWKDTDLGMSSCSDGRLRRSV